jgi:hypothetical protein
MGSAGAVGPTGAVGVAAVAAAGALAGQPVSAVGPSDDCPGPGDRLPRVALAVQLDHHVGAQGGVLLLAADRPIQLSRRPLSGREDTRVEDHKHRVQGRGGRSSAALAGRGDGALPDRFGLRWGMPRPWRVNALRSDDRVVPSSAAAALTLPSCSASWKARSASARSTRNRLGCQPSGWRSCPRPDSAPHSTLSGCCRGRHRAVRPTTRMRLRPAA